MAHSALKVEISLFNSLTKRISISQGQGPSVERMVKCEFEGREFEGQPAPTFTRAKRKQTKSPESTGSLFLPILITNLWSPPYKEQHYRLKMFRVLKQLLRSTAGDVVVLEWVTQQIYGYICTPPASFDSSRSSHASNSSSSQSYFI